MVEELKIDMKFKLKIIFICNMGVLHMEIILNLNSNSNFKHFYKNYLATNSILFLFFQTHSQSFKNLFKIF